MPRQTITRVYTNPFSIIISITAVLVSWFFNHSILWAIFHYIFAIPYLIYCLLIGRFADGGFMTIINSFI